LIIFIGLPGCGKSTVGRQVARRLGCNFVDSDAEIEKRIGCTIREFFEREGESKFRDIEETTLFDIVNQTIGVLSTGGGSILRQTNRERLREAGYVIYLRSTPDELVKRLRHDRNRPLLQVSDPLQKIRDLFDDRDFLYSETAHFVIETGRPSVATLVNMIVMQLELAGIQK
jgi:shikimate kinase